MTAALVVAVSIFAGVEMAFRSEPRLSPLQVAALKLKALRMRILIKRVLRKEINQDNAS